MLTHSPANGRHNSDGDGVRLHTPGTRTSLLRVTPGRPSPLGVGVRQISGVVHVRQLLIRRRPTVSPENSAIREVGLAIAAAINEMVEAATSADAKPAGSTKTSPDDDDGAGPGRLPG